MSAVVGCVVAIVLAYMKRGLLTVAVGAAGAVFLVQMIDFKTSGMDFSENNGEIYPGSFMFKR